MKLPRGLSGADLVAALKRLGYEQTRQTGSHVRMTVSFPRRAHLTVPLARASPAGTLAALIKDAAAHRDTSVEDIIGEIRQAVVRGQGTLCGVYRVQTKGVDISH